MDDDSYDDERSMPKLREQVLLDNEDSSDDEEDFSLSQEILRKMMEEMRILSKKHKKKKAAPTKIPTTLTSLTPSSGSLTPSRFLTVKQGTDKILGGIVTIRKGDRSKLGNSLSKLRQNAIVGL
eukprot:10641702-Ditylum_brightwellii.AAC.1